MAANYRVIVHYNFKKGSEEEGISYLENELVHQGKRLGCHYIELWQNEKNPCQVKGVAVWNSPEEAKKFQSLWEKKEKDLIRRLCANIPRREFCKLRSSYVEKMRQAA